MVLVLKLLPDSHPTQKPFLQDSSSCSLPETCVLLSSLCKMLSFSTLWNHPNQVSFTVYALRRAICRGLHRDQRSVYELGKQRLSRPHGAYICRRSVCQPTYRTDCTNSILVKFCRACQISFKAMREMLQKLAVTSHFPDSHTEACLSSGSLWLHKSRTTNLSLPCVFGRLIWKLDVSECRPDVQSSCAS